MTRHHRRPRSRGGDESPQNISMLHNKKHVAWHTLFRNMGPHQIADTINRLYLDPAYKFEVIHADQA